MGRPNHGHSHSAPGGHGSPTFQSWMAMRNRCLYPKHPAFARYGGRGISICEHWRLFENFLADMGERPAGTTLDRIDNDGDYEPGNCRWATLHEQNANRGDNRVIVVGARSMTLTEWADATGIGVTTLRERLRRGWPAERAIAAPLKPWQRMLTYRGETHSISEWARRTGLTVSAISLRITRRGWSVERALSTPARRMS